MLYWNNATPFSLTILCQSRSGSSPTWSPASTPSETQSTLTSRRPTQRSHSPPLSKAGKTTPSYPLPLTASSPANLPVPPPHFLSSKSLSRFTFINTQKMIHQKNTLMLVARRARRSWRPRCANCRVRCGTGFGIV